MTSQIALAMWRDSALIDERATTYQFWEFHTTRVVIQQKMVTRDGTSIKACLITRNSFAFNFYCLLIRYFSQFFVVWIIGQFRSTIKDPLPTFSNTKISQLIRDDNFQSWKQLVLLSACGFRVKEYLYSTLQFIIGPDGTNVENQDYMKFVHHNSSLASWLLASKWIDACFATWRYAWSRKKSSIKSYFLQQLVLWTCKIISKFIFFLISLYVINSHTFRYSVILLTATVIQFIRRCN